MNASVLNLLLLVFFIGLIYLMMIRPQRKKDREDRAMRESLKVGDEIMTIGGIVGKITKINERTVVLTTADRFKLEIVKSAVNNIVKKNTDAHKNDDKKSEPTEEASATNNDKKVVPKKLTKKSEATEEKAE